MENDKIQQKINDLTTELEKLNIMLNSLEQQKQEMMVRTHQIVGALTTLEELKD